MIIKNNLNLIFFILFSSFIEKNKCDGNIQENDTVEYTVEYAVLQQLKNTTNIKENEEFLESLFVLENELRKKKDTPENKILLNSMLSYRVLIEKKIELNQKIQTNISLFDLLNEVFTDKNIKRTYNTVFALFNGYKNPANTISFLKVAVNNELLNNAQIKKMIPLVEKKISFCNFLLNSDHNTEIKIINSIRKNDFESFMKLYQKEMIGRQSPLELAIIFSIASETHKNKKFLFNAIPYWQLLAKQKPKQLSWEIKKNKEILSAKKDYF
jgi:hypothetical protein